MNEKATEKEEITVREEQDGSVVAELPEGLAPENQDEDGQEDQQEAPEQSADDGGDEDHPDDTEAVRAARRARRRAKKELIKRTNQEKDQRLVLLQRQNQELMERLSVVERKTHTSDLARLDKAIEDEEMRLQYALTKIKQATEANDGTQMIRAQDMLYESRKKLEGMKNIKQKIAETSVNQSSTIDPKMRKYVNLWMDQNPWYDPQGDDEDSAIAKMIDERLIKEGWNPSTEDYWEELNERLQKRLPHLYNRNKRESPERRPRSFVTSAERETGGASGRNTFTLAPEQVRAMKDAGLWDDPEKRNRMIKRYAMQARNSRS
jgi:hypothetical protein